jgi:hypothetical protein
VGKGGTDMVDDSPMNQAAEQLAVHALLGIWAMDRLDGARVSADVMVPEMAAVAVGSDRGVHGQAGQGGIPRKGEHEVHPLAAFLLISMQMPAAVYIDTTAHRSYADGRGPSGQVQKAVGPG